MFGWFRKSAPAVQPTPQVEEAPDFGTGIFSTDIDKFGNKKVKPADIAQVMKRSLQLTAKDFLNANASKYAMDGIDGFEGFEATQALSYNDSMPWAQLQWYANQGFIGYQNCGIISQHWLIDKALTMPAQDAVRNGYETTVNDGTDVDPEILDFIRQRDKDFDILNYCARHVKKGRMFGIRVSWPVIDSPDKDYYEKPFNPDGIRPGSYKGMTSVDPYWVTPELDSEAVTPGSQHFYVPTWWAVSGRKIHRSHCVIMINGEVADILKPSYFYGGIPVPQKIAERVYAAERTANETPQLALTKRLFGYKTDLSQAAANSETFFKKIQGWVNFMNNYGVKVIGSDDELVQMDTSLADLDDATMTQYQLVAAAAEVPAVELLETTPKGFNATGEFEAKSYRKKLVTIQSNHMSPVVERHHLCLMYSEVMPKFKLKAPIKTEVKWNSVDTPTAKEEAEINKTKAETDKVHVDAGAIDGTDIRNRIVNDKHSGYNGIPEIVPGGPGDREAQQEADAPLEEPVQATNKQKDSGEKK